MKKEYLLLKPENQILIAGLSVTRRNIHTITNANI